MRRILLATLLACGLFVSLEVKTRAWWALTDSLVGCWAHESGALATDSKNAYNATNTGVTDAAAGKVGGAGQYTHSQSDNQSVADNNDLSIGASDWTLAAWVYLDSKGGDRVFASKWGGNTGTDSEFYLYYTSGSDDITFVLYNDSGIGGSVFANLSPSTATWYLIIATHRAGSNVGIQTGTGSTLETELTESFTGSPINGTAAFEMGTVTALGAYMDGRIDEVMVWKQALDSTERTALFNGGAGVTCSSLTGGGATPTKLLMLLGVG